MKYLFIIFMLISCQTKKADLEKMEEIPTKKVDSCLCDKDEIFEDGECKKIFYIVDPCKLEKDNAVCGCNNVTYSNACRAHQSGVKRFFNGHCGNKRERNY